MRDDDEIRDCVAETVIHEFGHYFGMSEEEIEEIEEKLGGIGAAIRWMMLTTSTFRSGDGRSHAWTRKRFRAAFPRACVG